MHAPSGTIPLKGGDLNYAARTLIMGILNVTPDSFSDGGRFYDPVRAVHQGIKLAQEGADILDVGGESTRPGSESVSETEELKRVLPVIQALAGELKIPISIDTQKAVVAARALELGASIVNDISCLRSDPEMADVVAEYEAGVVLMHMKGSPRDMQVDPRYDDLLEEIQAFLEDGIARARDRGVAPEKIIVDPGIGFGKTVGHNLQILHHLSHFRSLGKPILVGTSRKSFIGHILQREVDQREEGTAATVAIAVWNGANIVRVHDVGGLVPVIRMTDAIKGAGA